jgi:hypothetical protein
MNQTIGRGGGLATLPPRGIGEILSAAFQALADTLTSYRTPTPAA